MQETKHVTYQNSMASGMGLSIREEKEMAPCRRALQHVHISNLGMDFLCQTIFYSFPRGEKQHNHITAFPMGSAGSLFRLPLTWCSLGFAAKSNFSVALDEAATTPLSVLKVVRMLKDSYNSQRSAWQPQIFECPLIHMSYSRAHILRSVGP